MSDDQWRLLVDPAWQSADGQKPPAESVLGGWALIEGVVGRFEPNPDYEPPTPDSATDPVDAALRLMAAGAVDAEALSSVVREAEFGVALDEHQQPLLASDGVPSFLVTTAPAHRRRIHCEAWQVVNAAELAAMLADHEVDALLNPGSAAATRLPAASVAAAAGYPTP
ncbi:type VII secretion system-associated protein [Kutzneria sp. NPDC052558]|uniref:type VII secretion system-associated protein n=1 Tax=Kutzneria sp. NPDC052558 TaxID=3364121 RepID=UPI0037C7D8EA